MLIRLAPSLFQATTGDTIRIAAVAQKNNGPETAFFQYGPAGLPNVPAGQHPGCQFVVAHGMKTFGAQVVFAPGSPFARYDLFEVDAAGNLLDLQVSAQAMFFNSLVQFQIDGQPVASETMATAASKAFSGGAAAASGSPAPMSMTAAAARTAQPAGGGRATARVKSSRSKKTAKSRSKSAGGRTR